MRCVRGDSSTGTRSHYIIDRVSRLKTATDIELVISACGPALMLHSVLRQVGFEARSRLRHESEKGWCRSKWTSSMEEPYNQKPSSAKFGGNGNLKRRRWTPFSGVQ